MPGPRELMGRQIVTQRRGAVRDLSDEGSRAHQTRESARVGVLLAALIGVALGLLGGGGSILSVPLLAYVFGLDAPRFSSAATAAESRYSSRRRIFPPSTTTTRQAGASTWEPSGAVACSTCCCT